jgi:hypothetical protein
VHVFFLVGVRNRLSVMLGWIWSYFTFDVGVRLIIETRTVQPHTGTPWRTPFLNVYSKTQWAVTHEAVRAVQGTYRGSSN